MLKTLFLTIFLLLISFSVQATIALNKSVEHFQKFQHMLDQYRLRSGAPSASMSIRLPNKPIENFVSGTLTKKTANNPDPKKITSDSLFQIGSITKNFIAAIILQLEVEHKLSINDTIEATVKKYGLWLPKPGYLEWKKITIKQLLNMSSGIYNFTENKKFLKQIEKKPEKQWSALELLEYTYHHKPYFSPGKGYHYSDTNYIILGLLIQAVTKKSIQKTLKQRIFVPLQLKHTFYFPHLYSQKIMQQMAHGYGYTYLAGEFSPPEKVGTDMTRFNLSMGRAAGAMISTSSDLVRWLNALFNKKVIPAKQLKKMLSVICVGDDGTCQPGTPLPDNSKSNGYGLGIASFYDPSLGGTCWTYVGGTPGYYSVFLWVPKKKAALALTVGATTKNSRKLLRFVINIAKLLPNHKRSASLHNF